MTESSQGDVVSTDKFTELMAPTVNVIRQLTGALGGVAQRHGNQPWTPSGAMDEIAAETSTFAGKSKWDGPVRDTHSFGAITLMAASDYLHTFGEALATSPAPVFGHLVVSRAALESSVVSAWLNEPGVGAAERVKRGLCEQLYSASELVRLGLEDDAQDRVDRWTDVAGVLGWTVKWNRDKPVVEKTQRPSVLTGIEQLLVGDGDWKIGRVQWCYLSAVSHVTWWGLRQSILEPPVQAGALDVPLAGVGTASESVHAQAVCVIRALRKAAQSRFHLMAWKDAEWDQANAVAEAHELALIRAFQANQSKG